MRIALSLGSGGARGYVHIGVIDELRARGHEIVAIAGTSMGALVGGLGGGRKLEEYTDWVVTLTQRESCSGCSIRRSPGRACSGASA